MLLRNYGLFWKREDVFWGKPGVAGHLKGLSPNNRGAEPVDFRDQQGIYVLYDSSFHLLYVGQAGANDNHDLFERLRDHRKDQLSARWSQFSWFGIRRVNKSGTLAAKADGAHTTNGAVLNHMEAILIAAAEPPLNRQGGRFGSGVQQYLQHRDPRLGLDLISMIRELHQRTTPE